MTLFLTPSIRHEISTHGGRIEVHPAGYRGGKPVAGQSGTIHLGTAQIGSVEVGVRYRRSDKACSADLGLDEASKANGCTVKPVASQMRAIQIGLMHRGIAEIGVIGHCVQQHGTVQHRARQLGRGEPRRLHPRVSQIGGAEVSSRHLRAVKHGAREITLCHPGLGQVRQVEIGSGGRDIDQDRAAQLGAVEGGVGKVRARQVDAGQIRLLEIRAMQVAPYAGRQNSVAQVVHRFRICEQGQADENRD